MKNVKPKDKPLIIDKRDCILDSVQHTVEPKISDLDYLALIESYENEARNILKASGYPLSIHELLNQISKDHLPSKIRNALTMLLYFDGVRELVQEERISQALCFMAFGVRAAIKARIWPVLPDIARGKKTVQGASNGGKAKKQASDDLHQEWQEKADKIWEKPYSLSKADVGRMIVKQYHKDDKPTVQSATIARVIKK